MRNCGVVLQVLGYLYFTRIVLVLLSAMLPFQVTNQICNNRVYCRVVLKHL